MSTFLEMATRIVTDLRRGNLLEDAKQKINEAISEAAKHRFWFNEGTRSFVTVAGTEYYDDLGLTEIDAAWFLVGSTRYNLELDSQLDANEHSHGNSLSGQPDRFSRYKGQLRIYPTPSSAVTIYLDGYGNLTPAPLVADGDTNEWLSDGELYIRALAKSLLMRDVVRDYGEARVLEAIAEDYKDKLDEDTALRSATGVIKGTQW